jgi:ankyrin repeat protein
MNEISPIVEAHMKDFKTFADAIAKKAYSKALRRACTSIHPDALELVKVLLKYKEIFSIDINEQAGENLNAPIHYAIKKENNSLCQLLLLHGADADLKNKDGCSTNERKIKIS